jgi:hypothetical protein
VRRLTQGYRRHVPPVAAGPVPRPGPGPRGPWGVGADQRLPASDPGRHGRDGHRDLR